MDSPPRGPRPKAALPPYLTNGTSPLHVPSEVIFESRDQKERDNLLASIKASNTRRKPIEFNGPNGYFPQPLQPKPERPAKAQDGVGSTSDHVEEIRARDPRDEAAPPTPSGSRPHSPFTQYPTVDFDGLSWPSECNCSAIRYSYNY